MCVYHYEDSRRADCWIKILLLGCLGFSAAVSIPMFILTYPGDECLLFVSVRGEALIYGNPAGCNFIAYGHGIIGLIGKKIYISIWYTIESFHSEQNQVSKAASFIPPSDIRLVFFGVQKLVMLTLALQSLLQQHLL